MGRPKHTEGRDTRQALMDAALEIFSERGFLGASLKDVASAVGVRDSAIYHYFPSKEALFDAILEERREQQLERSTSLDEKPVEDLRAFLEALGMRIIERFQTRREQKLFRILMSDGLRLNAEGRLNLFQRMGAPPIAKVMERLVREGWLRSASPDLLWVSFFSPFWMWRQLLLMRPDSPIVRDPRMFVRAHVEQFLNGAGVGGQPI
jgi:AcrR family transcriptional regulator